MQISDIADILGKFPEEKREIILDKILDYGLKASGKWTALANAEAKLTKAKVDASKNNPSSIAKAITRDAKLYANRFRSNIRDLETLELLQKVQLTRSINSPDKDARGLAMDAVRDLETLGPEFLTIIASNCSSDIWNEGYPDLQRILKENLGMEECIKYDLLKNNYSAEVFSRHALTPLLKIHKVEVLDYEAAMESWRLQWQQTQTNMVRSVKGDTDWRNSLWQVDARILDILIFNTTYREKAYQNKAFMKLYKGAYTYVGSKSKSEHEAYGTIPPSLEEEKNLIDTQIEKIFTDLPYNPQRPILSYKDLHEAKTRPFWALRKSQEFKKIRENILQPCQEFINAIAQAFVSEIQ